MNKILLFFKIRGFYKLFAAEVGKNFITKLSDMTADNVHDVLFDISEVRDGYELEYDEYGMTAYLNKLYAQISDFCDKGGTK